MNPDVNDISSPEIVDVNVFPPCPAEACTELEFSVSTGGAAIEPAGRMERCLAAMRRWLGPDRISTES